MKRSAIAIVAFCAFCLAGCAPKEAADGKDSPKPVADAPQAAKDSQIDPEQLARDRAQATKLLEDGHVLPPRVVEHFDVIQTNDRLSAEDGKRAFEFRKTAFRHCYRKALAYDLELRGSVNMTVRRAGAGQAEVLAFDTTLEAEGIEACFREAARQWVLPEGAEMSFRLEYSTQAAPTPDEIRKVMDSHEGLDHDHDHEGHGHVEEAGAADEPH